MVNPRTVNTGIIVPLTGADVDLWGEVDVNPNMVAIDGMFGGVATIPTTGGNLFLTAPAGFTATPTPGPTQSQNRVLRFTGALTSSTRVILPLPGVYVIENLTTNPAWTLQFQGAVAPTEVIAVAAGDRATIYNDGSNVRYVDLGKCGTMEMWAGINAIPLWVQACTVKPYLVCDGSVYNFSDYPYLAAKLGGAFGGNGITTFAVPDMRGRVPLAYDSTGARITVAGCGINGLTIGSAQDRQSTTIGVANLPPYTPSGSIANGQITSNVNGVTGGIPVVIQGSAQASSGTTAQVFSQAASTFTGNAQGGTSAPMSNVPPAQVTGIWVIKT